MYTQDNSIGLRELLGNEIGARIQREKYFDFIKAENSCWPAVMFNLRLKIHEIEEFLSIVSNGIQSGKYPSVLITEAKDQGNEALTELAKRDIKFGHWTLMQHDLNKSAPFIENEQRKIIRVETEEHLAHWIRICETELMKGKMDERLFSSKLGDNNIHLFLGFDKDIPVSTSLIYYQEKESGLYMIATDGEYRGKGFGKAITHHALEQAKVRKCTLMNLEATDAGLPIYLSLGFQNHGPVSLINFAKKANEV